MLTFDAEVTRILDNGYQGADITRRRRASFDALKPGPGEAILDVGCGNGLLTGELARAVGPKGQIIGIDPSDDMLSVARERCGAFDNVSFLRGVATDLPLDDAVANKAVSVQVFEYIDDIRAAIVEVLRCIKPGGVLVISDLHLGSFIWFSDVPDRMERMKSSWDQHFASGRIPERLPALVRSEGHFVEDVVPVTLVDHRLNPDGVAMMMMHLMRGYAVDQGHLDAADAQAWFDEQVALARDGRFFFSITQFVCVARKSG